MGKKVSNLESSEVEVVRPEYDLIELSEGILFDARSTINSNGTLSVPIVELSTLQYHDIRLSPPLFLSITSKTCEYNYSKLYLSLHQLYDISVKFFDFHLLFLS